ncbi:hypothetical protein ABG768_004212 [Culter alburnus]|uniref:Uncharacterized protein n=1 Tax=Culter alburnus TaxID=194366 RepID=A0AAW1ZWA9_CULAL
MPSTSGSIVGQSFSPSLIRPFPKAGPRKETGRGRKKRRSEILTDTPVKLALEEEELWVKCVLCSFWAHQACTPGLTNFICHHCDSD